MRRFFDQRVQEMAQNENHIEDDEERQMPLVDSSKDNRCEALIVSTTNSLVDLSLNTNCVTYLEHSCFTSVHEDDCFSFDLQQGVVITDADLISKPSIILKQSLIEEIKELASSKQ